MGMRMALLGLGLVALAGGGCSLVGGAAQVAVHRVRQAAADDAERRRNRAWAEAAWAAVRQSGGHRFSEDHARGFVEGFATYVYRGAPSAEPPPLPPPEYRTLGHQTVQGYRAIECWFAGYRHGAEAARLGGYRELVTGPSSLRAPYMVAPVAPAPPLAGIRTTSLSPTGDVLAASLAGDLLHLPDSEGASAKSASPARRPAGVADVARLSELGLLHLPDEPAEAPGPAGVDEDGWPVLLPVPATSTQPEWPALEATTPVVPAPTQPVPAVIRVHGPREEQ